MILVMRKVREYVKDQIEKNLKGVTVNIKLQPFKQKLKLETEQDYDLSYAGWGPDYADNDILRYVPV